MATAEKMFPLSIPRTNAHAHASAANQSTGFLKSVSNGFARVFGCWHMEMSRPFTREGQTFRTCLHCGARRQFDLRTWETRGGFYRAGV